MIHDAPSSRSKSGVIARSTPVAPSFGEQRIAFPKLVRSSDGRLLSEARYRNGESFFLAIKELRFHDTGDLLYQTGIVAQMALSSHLLDVGFDDRWCARNIGLHIGKALAYANATGLNYQSPKFEQLALVLSPYNKWRNPDFDGSRPPVPASLPNIPPLLRDFPIMCGR